MCVCVHVCGFFSVVVLCETSKLCMQIPIGSTLVFWIGKTKGVCHTLALPLKLKKYLGTSKKNYRNSQYNF